MEDKKKKGFSLGETFLELTLFLLFGSKKSQKGKKQTPPIYAVAGVIIFLIFILFVIYGK